MKKSLSFLLMIIMVCALVLPLGGCGSKTKYKYAFITDLHVIANSVFTADNYESYVDLESMVYLSEAILNSLADELIENDYEYVLVGGDMTENGDEASHLACAAAFAKLEEKGIDVFVINGNHDIPSDKGLVGQRISSARFKEIYADFGYNEAIVTGSNTLSYVADINDDYRLIAVDTMVYYDDNSANTKTEAMSNYHIEWIKKQVEQCKVDGVTPIVITHDDLLNHYPEVAQIALDRTNNTQYEKLVAYLADNNANYVFAGHDHLQDIQAYTTVNGNVLYEVETGSMAMFPCSYREMSFNSKKIVINTKSFDYINPEYLSEYCSESIKTELNNGLQQYCYHHFYNYVYNEISTIGKEGGLLLSLDVPSDVKTVLNVIASGVADKVVNNPFYIADENNNTSLERILAGYGITIPQSQCYNVSDLMAYMSSILLEGDENLVNAPELDLLKYSVYSIFYYLNEVSPELSATVADYPSININLAQLFNDGILECYESNLVPFAFKIVSQISSTVYGVLNSMIGEDFDEIGSETVNLFLSSFTGGIVDDLSEYFVGKNLLLGKFIDDGIWGKYASDFVTDKEPSDIYLEIILD